MRIRVGSEAKRIAADRCGGLGKEAEAMVERAARRLVGRVDVYWGEEKGRVDERFQEGHWMRQRGVVSVSKQEVRFGR